MPEDFLVAVDPSRLVLEDKTISKDGKEISCDVYDEEGVLTNRTTFQYDETGKLISQQDFMDDFTVPYKEEKRTYSASGKILTVEVWFEGESGAKETHHYDNRDRLIEVERKDEDGDYEFTRYKYSDTSDNHTTEELYYGDKLVSRIRSEYNKEGKKTADRHERVNESYSTSEFRYYWNNEQPNNVFWEKYNDQGDFLEECREVDDAKGNLLHRSLHIDSAAYSEPYYQELYEYHESGVCTKTEYARNGIVYHSERLLLDDRNRVARRLTSESNNHHLTCYRYETKE